MHKQVGRVIHPPLIANAKYQVKEIAAGQAIRLTASAW